MKNSKTIVKTLAIALLAGAGLSGCVAVPYGPYGGPEYGGPVYSAPSVVVQPFFGFGFGHGHGGRGHHGGRHRR